MRNIDGRWLIDSAYTQYNFQTERNPEIDEFYDDYTNALMEWMEQNIDK